MKDAAGEVLYVGKAQSLRSRVRSYWQKQTPRARAGTTASARRSTASPTSRSREVDSVSEALLLEANLIKRFKPRFNVRLKDDKSYPYIKVTLGDDFPRIERTRKLPNDGSRYFGPYASASSRRRGDEPRPAAVPVPDLHDRHQGRRAGAPAAVPAVPHQALPGPVHRGRSRRRPTAATSSQVELFLEGNAGRAGRRPPPRDGLRRGAAAVREGGGRPGQDPGDRADDGEPEDGRVRADRAGPRRRSPARTTRRRSSCSSSATARCSAATCSSSTRRATRPTTRCSAASSSSTTRARRASRARSSCRARLADTADLEAFLAERRGSRVRLRTPQRGEKRELMELATRNAAETLAREAARWLADEGRTLARARGAGRRARAARAADADRVLRHLELPGRASRSAAWSCSRRAGRGRASTAGSGSGPSRAPTTSRATRRCCAAGSARAKAGEEGIEEERRWAMPDLVIIDGGRGQVSAAKEVLDELGLHDLPLVGPGQGARGAGPARTGRAGRCCRPRRRRCTSSSGCATRRTGSRSRTTATCAPSGRRVGVRRPARRRPEAAPRAAQGVRLGEAGPGGAGGADRRGARASAAKLAEKIKAHLEA